MGSHNCCDMLMILIFLFDQICIKVTVLPGRTFSVILIHQELPPTHWRAKKLNNWRATENPRFKLLFWMFLWLQGPSLNLWREPTQVSYGWLSVRDSLFVAIPKKSIMMMVVAMLMTIVKVRKVLYLKPKVLQTIMRMKESCLYVTAFDITTKWSEISLAL